MIFRENLIVTRPDQSVFMINLITFRRKTLPAETYELFEQISSKTQEEYTDEEQELVIMLEAEAQFLSSEEIELIESKIMKDRDDQVSEDNSTKINLILTYGCNANCIYCFQSQIEGLTSKDLQMTPEHIDKIDEFHRQFAEELKYTDNYKIGITGGEPLLAANRPILNYIFNKWDDARYFICTNGVNLDCMIDEIPAAQVDQFKISLDGVEEIHNQRRPVSGIVNPFGETVKGIEKALKKEVKVLLKITVDRETIHHVPELLRFIDSQGWIETGNLQMGFTGVFTRESGTNLDPAFNTPKEMVDSLIALRKIDSRIAYMRNNVFYGLGGLRYALLRPANLRLSPRVYGCGVLQNSSYTFDPSGQIYLCGDIVATAEGVLGRYFPEIKFDLEKVLGVRERNVFAIEQCRKCAFRFVCGGGCPAIALRNSGDLMQPACNYFTDEYVLEKMGELFL